MEQNLPPFPADSSPSGGTATSRAPLPELSLPSVLFSSGEGRNAPAVLELDPGIGRDLARFAESEGRDPISALAAGAAYALSCFCRQEGFVLGLPALPSAPGAAPSCVALEFDARPLESFRDLAARIDAARRRAPVRRGAAPALGFVEEGDSPKEALSNASGLIVGLSPRSLSLRLAAGNLDEDIARSLARSMAAVLGAALRDPGLELSRLPLMEAREAEALFARIRGPERPGFAAIDLYDLISRSFAAYGHRRAVSCEGLSLSYAGLAEAVAAASAELAAAGATAGGTIGICLPRSIDMLVAVLAVLRSGCAYLPLDPSFPKERLEYIVSHSGVSLVIGSDSARALLCGKDILDISGRGAAGKTAPPPARVPASHPAYVIYTSGSTGKPKGVVVPRSAAANLLSSMLERPGMAEDDVLCAVTTLSFDISVLELLAPLCRGASIALATEADARDPRALSALLSSSGATILQATPITWRMLRESGWEGSPGLKALCGGEAMPAAMARDLVPRVRELWNMYGPTETTVWSSCGRVEDPGKPISVGSPIANTRAYLLDDFGRPLPPGAEGRLFLGGAGLAIGYHADPGLTAERFVPDPFVPGARMYDTGDLARLEGDGKLVILGRSDFQVKLNGFRIELGEIEACVCDIPGIAQAAAVLDEGEGSDPSIAAFYVLAPGAADPGSEGLRHGLASRLPRYMLPARFVRLDAMPRGPNGKTDRKALPALLRAGRPRGQSPSGAGLSKVQEQFLVAARLFEGSRAYTIATLFEFEGSIDEARLRDAWRRVRASAPILRSAIAPDGSGLVETEAGEEDAFQAIECAGADPHALAEGIADRPLSPRDAPLSRLYLIRPGKGRDAVLLVQHHIVTDLFSTRLLARLIGQAYDDPGFSPQTIPYARFIEAEAAYVAGEEGPKAEAHWRAVVADIAEPLALPHATYRPAAFEGRGRSLPWSLSAPLCRRLEEREAEGKAPFLLMLCAYAALLHRLSGQERFLIGVPLTNRLLVGEGPLLGPCVNILPVAARIDGTTSFEALYAQLRRELLLGNRYQAWPFIKIASAYGGSRDPLRPRLLQAGFTNEPLFGMELGGLSGRPSYVRRDGAQMDLFFSWWKRGQAVEGHWEYNSGSFDESDARLWQDLFPRLLEAALDSPGESVAGLPLLPAGGRLPGRGPERAYDLGKSLAGYLRDSYAAHADLPALSFEGRDVSYSELGAKAAAIASCLRAGPGPGGRIAVILPRSPEMLYALHGIALSGNAYVPIGIDWPGERALDVLRDVRPSLVIGAEEFRDRTAPSGVAFKTVPELLSGPGAGLQPAEAPIDGRDPVYILYTSGTTGRPKGAILPHRGIVNRLLWMQEEYRLAPGDSVLLKTPYTFDVSAWELFWPFLAGARLVILGESLHKDPREILAAIDREAIRVLHFVPSMLSHFLSQPGLERARSLRDVICSGEALSPELVGKFYAAFPGAALHNLYGPTEASIDVTYWRCSPRDRELGVVPIGHPIANVSVLVLDRCGNPCPPYVKGEIHLGGVCLASGYWEREELSREKFIPDPSGGGRLYRTGDLGRYRLDGAIEYFDRIDSQIKVHGIRIEVEEIEARLRALPGLLEAVVRKGSYDTGEECLVAYYLAADAPPFDPEGAKLALRSYLPEAMVPSAFVRMEAFPLSANGKLDRKALPAVVPRARANAAAPRAADETERLVGRAWSAAIGIDAAAPDRNFFDAGGNSLSLLSLRGALEAEFGVELKIIDLFQNPTIASMAALIRSARGGAAAPGGEGAGRISAAERAKRRRDSLKRGD